MTSTTNSSNESANACEQYEGWSTNEKKKEANIQNEGLPFFFPESCFLIFFFFKLRGHSVSVSLSPLLSVLYAVNRFASFEDRCCMCAHSILLT